MMNHSKEERQRYSDQQIIDALTETGGVISKAAQNSSAALTGQSVSV